MTYTKMFIEYKMTTNLVITLLAASLIRDNSREIHNIGRRVNTPSALTPDDPGDLKADFAKHILAVNHSFDSTFKWDSLYASALFLVFVFVLSFWEIIDISLLKSTITCEAN